MTIGDIDDAMLFWGDRDVMRYCCGSTCDRDDIGKAIVGFGEQQRALDYSVYGIVEKANGRLVGACGFKETDEQGKVELICHLNKDYWGRGFATEAVNAAIFYLNGNPDIRKIEAAVYPENHGSIHVLVKSGFRYRESKWVEDSKCHEPFYELYPGH